MAEQDPEPTARNMVFDRVAVDGLVVPGERMIAVETPVALELDGLAYAVLMASPSDIEDLAFGFALTERLIDRAEDIRDIDIHHAPNGVIVRITLAPSVAGRAADRVRHRTGDTACGLCGVESLDQALRPLPVIAKPWRGGPAVVFAAAAALDAHQNLNRATRSVHAAAQCAGDGAIVTVREDVGRHNAFDKLIGAMLRSGTEWDDGFALLSSRCSFELVEKAAIAGCPMLATVSAPTELALRRAQEAGLALNVLVRPDALLTPHRNAGAERSDVR